MQDCVRCGGTTYTDTDKYGRHKNCFQCGASRVIEVALMRDLWAEAHAAEGPGGLRGEVLHQPYGKVIPQ